MIKHSSRSTFVRLFFGFNSRSDRTHTVATWSTWNYGLRRLWKLSRSVSAVNVNVLTKDGRGNKKLVKEIWNIRSAQRGCIVESSAGKTLAKGCGEDEQAKASCAPSTSSILRNFVRRLSGGNSSAGGDATGTLGNSRPGIFGGCVTGGKNWRQGLGVGGGGGGEGTGCISTTVSTSGARLGRAGTVSRRASRESSPSKVPVSPGPFGSISYPSVEDDTSSFIAVQNNQFRDISSCSGTTTTSSASTATTTSSTNSTIGSSSGPTPPPPLPQDWRRLVGSIRRKVRRKTTSQNTVNSKNDSPSVIPTIGPNGDQTNNATNVDNETILYPPLPKTTCSKNQDDFLKATMRIFLVVSPPMGRVQVRNTISIFVYLFNKYVDTG